MADEETIAGTGEQEATQESPAETVQAGAASADPALDAATDGAADVEPVAVTDDVPDLDALWTRYPNLRAQQEAAQAERDRDREQAGANRERARLQREAGAREVTPRNVARFLERTGVTVEDPRELHYFQDLALAHETETAVKVVDSVLASRVSAEVQLRARDIRDQGVVIDGERVPNVEGYLNALRDGDVAAQLASSIGSMGLKDVPAGSNLRKEIDAENQRWRAAEVRAARLEAAPRNGAMPAAPRGGSPRGITVEELNKMPTNEFLAKTPEEQQRLVDESRASAAAAARR